MDLQNIFDSVAEKLRIDFKNASSQIDHKGSKGKVREAEIVDTFFREYLPKNVEIINGGEIVSTDGQTSNECDILVNDVIHCPIFLDKTGFRIMPIECVYGVFEVKSKLDTKELKDSYDKINKLKKFPKIAYEPQMGQVKNYIKLYDQELEYFPTVGFIFAYDSIDLFELKIKLEEIQKGEALEHRIDAVWVLNKGMIVNWEDKSKKVVHTPNSATKLIAIESTNPLLVMTVHLQQLFQAAWMRPFNIHHYMKNVNWGRVING